MTVDTFDPGAMAQPIDAGMAAALCASASESQDNQLHLSSTADVQRFAPLASHAAWSELADSLSNEKITALIKIFTLGEMQFASWASGDKSPVVPLVKMLKQRGEYSAEMTRWIKDNSTNRFLPHGNLLNRL